MHCFVRRFLLVVRSFFYFYYTEFHREITQVRRGQGNVSIWWRVTQRSPTIGVRLEVGPLVDGFLIAVVEPAETTTLYPVRLRHATH